MAIDNSIAQFGGSTDGGIFREVVLDGGNGGVFNMLWRREMRLAGSEVHYVNALLAQFIGFSYNRHGCRRLDAIYACRKFHSRNCFSNWCHNLSSCLRLKCLWVARVSASPPDRVSLVIFVRPLLVPGP